MGKTVIFLFAFGDSKESNDKLVEELKMFSPQVPIFSQESVALTLRKKYPNRTIFIANQERQHISSCALIDQFLQYASEQDWDKVIIIAAKQHIWRCRRDLAQTGFAASSSIKDNMHPVKTGYQAHDPQSFVRNHFRWWLREIIIRLLPYKIYKLVTKNH